MEFTADIVVDFVGYVDFVGDYASHSGNLEKVVDFAGEIVVGS